MLNLSDSREAPQRLIFYVLLVFVLLNLVLPGESSTLTLILSQVIIFGFTGLYVLFIRPRFEPTLWILPATFFGLALVVSQYVSMHGYGSLRTGLQLLSMVLLAWLVADIGLAKKDLLIALGSLVALAAVLSVIGIMQIYTFFNQPLESGIVSRFLPVNSDYLNLMYSQKRIFSTFVLPTSFSAFLAIVFPLAAALAIQYRDRMFVLAGCSAAMLLMAVAMLQAQSNGGPVSLAIGCAATALLYAKDRKLPLHWFVLGAIAAGIVLIAVIGLLRGNYLWDLGAHNSSIRLRWNLWVSTFAMIGQHGLFGIGAGNFELGYLPFVEHDVRASKFAHNTYLQIPLELGVLGLIALVTAIILIYRAVLRSSRQREDIPLLRYGIIAAAVVFLVANFYEIVLYFHSLGLLGSLVLGIMLSRQNRTEKETTVGAKPRLSAIRVSIALGCIAAMLFLGRWFLADHYYERATAQLTLAALNEGGTGAESLQENEDTEDIDTPVEDLVRTAIAVDPGNYRYHFLLASVLEESEGDNDVSILEEYSKAIDLCPGLPYLHYNFGLALARKGSLLLAAQEFAEAARLNPVSEEYRSTRKLVEDRFQAMLQGGRR